MRSELVTTLKRQATELLSDLERDREPILITQHGFSFAIAIAGVMAIVAGLILIPLKYSPPVWKDEEAAARLNGRAAVARG